MKDSEMEFGASAKVARIRPVRTCGQVRSGKQNESGKHGAGDYLLADSTTMITYCVA